MANITTRNAGAGDMMSAEAFASAGEQSFNAAKPESTSGGVPFLKLDKETGIWTFGQEDTTIPDDALLAVFPNSFATGFVAWKGLTLEAKSMARIGQDPVRAEDLDPVASKTGWEPNVAVALAIDECPSRPELEGTIVLFEQRSRGGIEAWNKLYDATLARAKGGHPFAAIVSLKNTSYDHKEWGKVFKPVFSPEDWDQPAEVISRFGQPPALTDRTANDKDAEADAPKPASRRARGGDGARDVTPKDDVPDAEVVSEQAPRRRRRGA